RRPPEGTVWTHRWRGLDRKRLRTSQHRPKPRPTCVLLTNALLTQVPLTHVLPTQVFVKTRLKPSPVKRWRACLTPRAKYEPQSSRERSDDASVPLRSKSLNVKPRTLGH